MIPTPSAQQRRKDQDMTTTKPTTETKHTPGPWKIVEQRFPVCIIEGEDGTCVVGNVSGQPGLDGQTANARLIAAAPELLEALRDCLATLDGLKRHNTNCDYVAAIQARAAIAKAERGA
jgi:hypothetical protein